MINVFALCELYFPFLLVSHQISNITRQYYIEGSYIKKKTNRTEMDLLMLSPMSLNLDLTYYNFSSPIKGTLSQPVRNDVISTIRQSA